MKKTVCFWLLRILPTILTICSILPMFAFANTEANDKYYLGETVNAGKDTGYSEANQLEKDDPHFGWKLGDFFVSGHTSHKIDAGGNPIFLKNVGDQLTLWFSLKQNINKLNANERLSICEDTNGYDKYFEVPQTNFQKGALIIRRKTSENKWENYAIYTNYLDAKTSEGANTQVDLFEEGDYEVALNYEIKEQTLDIFGWDPLPNYYNYRIFFRFSVRNGNCMVYPFDISTKAELTNSAFTENGFYLDLANSKYLSINIQKEILKEGTEGLVEDIRFNKPAKDGEQFTEEGIYTITVTNEYTNQETVKKIYVGTNNVLKAHVATGLSIQEINHQISLGATVGQNGELIAPPVQEPTQTTPPGDGNSDQNSGDNTVYVVLASVGLFGGITALVTTAILKKKKGGNNS